jgi:hypothetical protein
MMIYLMRLSNWSCFRLRYLVCALFGDREEFEWRSSAVLGQIQARKIFVCTPGYYVQ